MGFGSCANHLENALFAAIKMATPSAPHSDGEEKLGRRQKSRGATGIGTSAAYRGHNHYGSRKHPTLPRQKDLSRSYRIDLPLFHLLFRSIALLQGQLYTLR
jgi:hypothetical protein